MKEIQSIDISIGEVWIQTVYRHYYWGGGDTNSL